MRKIRSVDDMCLLDDVLMNVVFDDDTETTAEMLRIIMGIPDLRIISAKSQFSANSLQNRSTRFDVKAVDSTGTNYDIEVQRSDAGATAKRARFNASMMNRTMLKKGSDFDELPKLCVIFITEHDVLKGNRPIYHIYRTISEKEHEIFDDDEEIIYVNCEYNSDRRNTDIEKLIHDFKCVDPSEMYLPQLAKKTSECKSERETRGMLSEWVERNYGDQFRAELAVAVEKEVKKRMKTFIKETEKIKKETEKKKKEYKKEAEKQKKEYIKEAEKIKKEAEKTKQIYKTSMIRTVYENVRKDFDEDKDAIRYVAKILSTTSKKVREALETNV